MTNVTLEQVQQELEAAKQELKQNKDNIKGLVAQLEATKGMFNEQLAANLQLRTNLNLFLEANKEFTQENEKLKKDIEGKTAQVQTLAAKVLELTQPKLEPVPAQQPVAA